MSFIRHRCMLYTIMFSIASTLAMFPAQQEAKRNTFTAMHCMTIKNQALSRLFEDICKFPTVLHAIIFDMLSVHLQHRATAQKAHAEKDDGVLSLAFLCNGRFASLGHRDIKIWSINPLVCLRTLPQEKYFGVGLTVLSPDRILTYPGYCTRPLMLHDISKATATSQQISPPIGVRALVALPRDQIAFCEIDQSTISIRDVAPRKFWQFLSPKYLKEIRTLTGHGKPVCTLSSLPNDLLASGSEDETIRIWNIISGICLQTMSGHSTWVMACVALPNNILASYDFYRSIKVWNTLSGKCLHTIAGSESDIRYPAYTIAHELQTLSGQYLIALYLGQVKIWDILTGKCLQSLPVSDKMTVHKNRFVVNANNQLIIGDDAGNISLYEMTD